VEANGVGYFISVPNPLRQESKSSVEVLICTELIVREGSHTLYGFMSAAVKDMFNSLLKVTGIGPKSSFARFASTNRSQIVEDSAFMQKFPGIGKKTASQIILDLKGKLKVDLETIETSYANDYIDEALLTLEALGYSKRELARIEKKLSAESFQSVDEAVKTG